MVTPARSRSSEAGAEALDDFGVGSNAIASEARELNRRLELIAAPLGSEG
jgi:hypothetical protein